jgi:hypothetical protein
MEAEQGEVQLGHDKVLVVTRITDQGRLLTVAGNIESRLVVYRHGFRSLDPLDQECGPSSVDGGIVKVGRGTGASSVDVVEVE